MLNPDLVLVLVLCAAGLGFALGLLCRDRALERDISTVIRYTEAHQQPQETAEQARERALQEYRARRAARSPESPLPGGPPVKGPLSEAPRTPPGPIEAPLQGPLS